MSDVAPVEIRRGRITTLVINRPDKLNALNYPAIDMLSAALDEIEGDDEIRAVVLTGAGDRAFSAGADIDDVAGSIGRGVQTALREVVARGQGFTRRIENFPKPIIAAVNGLAFGGGCELTEAAPLAIASHQATFAKPEIRLGFPPPFGGSQRLAKHIGRKRALEMILTGDAIGAARAAEIGIVNYVVEHGDLLDEAHSLAERVIRHPSLVVTACLAAVTRGFSLPIDQGLALEAGWFATAVSGDQPPDGLLAFVNRHEHATSEGSVS